MSRSSARRISRRQALQQGLQWMGYGAAFSIALPMLEATFGERAFAAAARRKRFIGVFFPNGGYMPGAINGNWTYGPWAYRTAAGESIGVPEGALSPLLSHRDNIMVLRGIINGGIARPGADQHWCGTSGYLSCGLPVYGDSSIVRCQKSFDHVLADQTPGVPLRPVAIGWRDRNYSEHPETHSPRYLSAISWASPTVPSSRFLNPVDFFNRIIGRASEVNAEAATAQAAYQAALTAFRQGEAASLAAYQTALAQASSRRAALQFMWNKKKSVLDGVVSQIADLRSRLGSEDSVRLESYLTGMREIETSLGSQMTTLIQQASNPPAPQPGSPPQPPANLGCNIPTDAGSYLTSDFYIGHFHSMHRILVKAMQCDLTRTATIMYDDSVGQIELLYSSIDPMATTQHHQSAHHSGLPNWIRSQHAINKIHTGLLAHLLSEMKKVPGLLEDTLVLYGSDMSDGDQHLAHNLPILLAGAGADLKFGQEVGDPSARRRLADLFVEMGRDVYGIPGFNSFGEGANASMGSTIGITR